MSINFPDSPSPGQVYTFGSRSWTWNGYAWSAVANTNIVTSFNGLTGAVEGVSSVNGQTGAVTITSLSGGVTGIVGGTGIFVSGQTGNVTITNIGVLSVNGQTGNVTITVSSSDGVTGIVGGTGIAVSGQTGNVTIANIGVLSVNGATGSITNVAKTNVAQTFTAMQKFDAGICGGITFYGNSGSSYLEIYEVNNGIWTIAANTGGIYLNTNNAAQIQFNSSGGIQFSSSGGDLSLFQSDSAYYFSINSPYKARIGDYDGCCDGMFIGLNEPFDLSPNAAGFYVYDWPISTKVFEITNSAGVSGSYIYMRPSDGLIVQSGATFTGNIYAPNIVMSVNGQTGAVTIAAGSGGATGPTGSVQYNNGSGGFSGSSKLKFNSIFDAVEITTQRMLLGDHNDNGSGENLFVDLNYDENGYFKIYDNNSVSYPFIVSSAFNTGSSRGAVAIDGNINVTNGNILLITSERFIQ